jgi:hypothetical protein
MTLVVRGQRFFILRGSSVGLTQNVALASLAQNQEKHSRFGKDAGTIRT